MCEIYIYIYLPLFRFMIEIALGVVSALNKVGISQIFFNACQMKYNLMQKLFYRIMFVTVNNTVPFLSRKHYTTS